MSDTEVSIAVDGQSMPTLIKTLVLNTLLIGLWYFFSISISVYNKWMFGSGVDDVGHKKNVFPFPLFTTSFHMVIQFCLASLILYIFPSLRSWRDPFKPRPSVGRTHILEEHADPKKPFMSWWFYLTRIGPCGTATGLDIGFGNMSLEYITLTFYTMCKSSVLGFVLLFAFLFRLEKPSWKLGAIVVVMTIGVIMMVAGETAFNMLGFVLIMASALSSGFRWSVTQILLLRNPATSNPFSSIFFLAPVMFLSLLLFASFIEGIPSFYAGLKVLFHAHGAFIGTFMLIFPGCLAFMMTSSEFALLKRTSVITLSICGIFKEVVTLLTASIIFDDQLTTVNLSGVIITIASIAVYNYMKIIQMREAKVEERTGGGTTNTYEPLDTYESSPESDSYNITRRGSGSVDVLGDEQRQGGVLSTKPKSPLPALTSSDRSIRVSPVKKPEDLE